VIQDNIELLLECLPHRIIWKPVTEFLKLNGVHLLIQLVNMGAEWNTYVGKYEFVVLLVVWLRFCFADWRRLPGNIALQQIVCFLNLFLNLVYMVHATATGLPSPGGCAHMWAAMYYILTWMLASSIPHVDGACKWLPYFDIALYILCFVRLLRLSIFKIKEIFIYLLCLFLNNSCPRSI